MNVWTHRLQEALRSVFVDNYQKIKEISVTGSLATTMCMCINTTGSYIKLRVLKGNQIMPSSK